MGVLRAWVPTTSDYEGWTLLWAPSRSSKAELGID